MRSRERLTKVLVHRFLRFQPRRWLTYEGCLPAGLRRFRLYLGDPLLGQRVAPSLGGGTPFAFHALTPSAYAAIKSSVMVGYTQEAVIQKYAESGFVATLQKPVDLEAFQGVRSWITRS